ncbi:MAG: polysaccharide biosynthesis tyrosine autokinase [Pseudomonadota bacterium]
MPQAGVSALTPADFDDSVEIVGVLRAIWHRKVLIVSMTVLVASLLFIFAMAQPRSFTATATVMLDPREQRVLAAQDQVVSDLKLSSPILESEVAIIKSARLLRGALTEVGLDRFSPFYPTQNVPSVPARIWAQLVDWVQPAADQTLAPPTAIDPEAQRINAIIHRLRQGLSVTRLGDSYVIEVSVKTPDPVLSADTANALAEHYIAQQLQERRRVAESATQWLSDQVSARRSDLASAEAGVERFRREQIHLSRTDDSLLEQQLAALNAQLVDARAARTTETARLDQIRRLIETEGAIAAAETQQSPFVLAIRTDQAALSQEDRRLSETYGPQHPERQRIAAQLAQLAGVIEREVANIAQAYANEASVLALREEALQAEVGRIQTLMADRANETLALRQLERDAEAARETYNEVLSRLGETRAQTEIQRAEARLVNEAQIPLAPSAPRIKLLTAFGASLGLTLGLLAALSLETISAGFLNAAEVERATGLPVLTTIPYEEMSEPSDVLSRVNGHGFSLFAERMRHLRTMIEMRASPANGHAIVVLSSLPNEGKTSTALALARAFATMGRKTLLLDLDTRRSALTHKLTNASLRDLGDYLAGDANLSEVIYGDDTLGFSVAGSSRYTAILADSVSAGVLNDVLDELRGHFEVIVIDSPPLLAVSDGLQIASVADDILYLIQHRKTARKSAFYGLSALHHLGLRPTGIVLTKARDGVGAEHYAGSESYGKHATMAP